MRIRSFLMAVLLMFLLITCLDCAFLHCLKPRISKVSSTHWRIDWFVDR